MQKNVLKFSVLTILLLVGFFRLAPSAQAAINLLTNPGAETIDFRGWNLTNTFDDGWWITGGDYAHSGLYSFISSYNLDTMSQEIDLLAKGYSASALDNEPSVTASTFVAGHWPNASDAYRVVIELRDENHDVIDSFDTGAQNAAGDHIWTEISHTFTDYGSGLRYIYFRQEGDDAEFWAGRYGTVFDDASLTIGGAGPSLSITAPGNGQTVSSWSPNVSWGNSTSCKYSYDGLTYTTVNCASHGADIAQTQSTLNPTLYLAGIDAAGNSTVVSSTFTQTPSNPFSFGLVGHWKFDETVSGTCPGGKDVCDSSLSGNHGTYGDAPIPSTEIPSSHFVNPRSLSFNGASNYVSVARPVADDFSICAWIKTATPGNSTNHWETAPIFDAEVPGLANDFGFGIDSDGHLAYGNGGLYDATVNGATVLTDDAWHHVCVTRKEATREVELFVDGTSDATGSTHSAVLNSSSTARIGYGLDGVAAKYFDGLIDEVRVYERALPSSMIRDLAQGYVSTDRTAPVITLNGNATAEVYVGNAYTDAGATALDNVDGNITDNITVQSTVNTAIAGTYTVTYSVADSSLNSANQVIRTVRVVAAGSSLSPQAYLAPLVPENGFQFKVVPVANSSNIGVSSNAGADIAYVALSTSPAFTHASLIPYQSVFEWNPCDASGICPSGSYTVYVKFYTKWGQPSPVQTFAINPPAQVLSAPAVPVAKAAPKNVPKKLLVTKTLSQGMTNEEVRILQTLLAKDPSIYPEAKITGYFGSLTLQAVQKFQIKYGIAAKGSAGFGTVGARTRAKLAEIFK